MTPKLEERVLCDSTDLKKDNLFFKETFKLKKEERNTSEQIIKYISSREMFKAKNKKRRKTWATF